MGVHCFNKKSNNNNGIIVDANGRIFTKQMLIDFANSNLTTIELEKQLGEYFYSNSHNRADVLHIIYKYREELNYRALQF